MESLENALIEVKTLVRAARCLVYLVNLKGCLPISMCLGTYAAVRQVLYLHHQENQQGILHPANSVPGQRCLPALPSEEEVSCSENKNTEPNVLVLIISWVSKGK